MCGAICSCGRGTICFDGTCNFCICAERTELNKQLTEAKGENELQRDKAKLFRKSMDSQYQRAEKAEAQVEKCLNEIESLLPYDEYKQFQQALKEVEK